jgi:hypothetical protein
VTDLACDRELLIQRHAIVTRVTTLEIEAQHVRLLLDPARRGVPAQCVPHHQVSERKARGLRPARPHRLTDDRSRKRDPQRNRKDDREARSRSQSERERGGRKNRHPDQAEGRGKDV